MISYISLMAMPLVILIIIIFAVKEKKDTFDLFIDGAKEGIEITIKIFPTLIGIFFSIGLLRNSGIMDMVIKIINPITRIINFPTEIIPLALIRPISGSGAIGIATDIMKNNGVDSYIGKVASVIMGSTETTIYTIAVYTAGLKVKINKDVLIAALFADAVGIICSVIFCRIMS
ncbi:MAG: spore maturation protein [Clostridia bacterium]|nr:spore maturation protein [Clostridia bacterium]MBR3199464.1 spore maturation protein [Bacilli bacterium]